jgi:hypothetical protein
MSDLVLMKLDTARNALAEAKTIQETKAVLDVAIAAETYAKRQKLGEDAVRYATSIKVEALRQLGEMLKETQRNKGASGSFLTGDELVPVRTAMDGTPTLAEMGLDKKTSKLAQDIASLPDEVIEKVKEGIVSLSGAQKAIKTEKAHAQFTAQTKEDVTITPLVEVADVNEWLNKMPLCDLLLTDPPYSTDIEDIFTFAGWIKNGLNRVKDTGRAYVFIGGYPIEALAYLSQQTPEHILLEQMLVWTYKNTLGNNPKDRYKLNYQFCLYYKGINAKALNCPLTTEQWAVIEMNAPDGRMGDRYHTWQKPLDLAKMIVRHSTNEGDTVYDPFTCTGTFLLAASALGRNSFGCDISKDNLNIAIERGCKYAGL